MRGTDDVFPTAAGTCRGLDVRTWMATTILSAAAAAFDTTHNPTSERMRRYRRGLVAEALTLADELLRQLNGTDPVPDAVADELVGELGVPTQKPPF